MITISIDENMPIERTHFTTVEDFQLYIVAQLQSAKLSDEHKLVLDERLSEVNENPANYLTLEELKKSIKRK